MSDKDQVKQLLYKFLYEGLVSKDLNGVMKCLSKQICGIGIGEQGFVASTDDVRNIYSSGLKSGDTATHSIFLGRVETLILEERFAFVCADVLVTSRALEGDADIQTQFQQSLSMTKASGEWLICGLHATAPTVTEEALEAYPLYFAEKTLRSLKERIGEQAYAQEEQYRKAVLADAIAFYIVDFTAGVFEKCELHNDLCIYAEPDTPYTAFVNERSSKRVFPADLSSFLHIMSLENIFEAFDRHELEVSLEYRVSYPDDSGYFWAKTIVRLITDVDTGYRKGIVYVKNIDEDVRELRHMREQADYDSMTGLLNRAAMVRAVNKRMQATRNSIGGIFLIVKVDCLGSVNDSYGSDVRDSLLLEISRLLCSTFGEVAVVGRLGVDEFAVFLPGQRPGSALRQRTDRLVQSVADLSLAAAPDLRSTISLGSAHLEDGSYNDLYQLANKAMCDAKDNSTDTADSI